MTDAFRALPGLGETISEIFESAQGRMAVVTGSRGHMVQVRMGDQSSGDDIWYPSTTHSVSLGAVGVLLPLRGGMRLFIPTGPADTPAVEKNPMWRPGTWVGSYNQFGKHGSIWGTTLLANRPTATPIIATEDMVVDMIGLHVMGAGGGSGIVGVFESSPTTGLPVDPPLGRSIAFSMSTTGTKNVFIDQTQLRRGRTYWIAIVSSVDLMIAHYNATSTILSSTSYSHSIPAGCFSTPGSFSLSMPSTSTVNDAAPALQLRRRP